MIQQSHYWLYNQGKFNHHAKEESLLSCLLEHYSQESRNTINLTVHHLKNG